MEGRERSLKERKERMVLEARRCVSFCLMVLRRSEGD